MKGEWLVEGSTGFLLSKAAPPNWLSSAFIYVCVSIVELTLIIFCFYYYYYYKRYLCMRLFHLRFWLRVYLFDTIMYYEILMFYLVETFYLCGECVREKQ